MFRLYCLFNLSFFPLVLWLSYFFQCAEIGEDCEEDLSTCGSSFISDNDECGYDSEGYIHHLSRMQESSAHLSQSDHGESDPTADDGDDDIRSYISGRSDSHSDENEYIGTDESFSELSVSVFFPN